MKKILVFVLILTVAAASAAPFVFTDNAPHAEETSADALTHIYNQNIIEGYADGELHPDYTLTRAQFARFLVNAFPDVATHELAYAFSDLTSEHWAYSDVQKAVNAGWIQGYPDSTFRPDENIVYEQAVTVICRVLGILPNGGYPEGYISSAIEHTISDGVNAMIGEVINREQAAKLIVNAMSYSAANEAYDGGTGLNRTYFSSASGSMNSASVGYGGGGAAAVITDASVTYESEAFYDIDTGFYAPPVYPPNSEEYTAEDENVFKNTLTSPLSTFSIDTDTASYSNLRRFILSGQPIPAGLVRSEELINYFDYAKAKTEDGKPFGVKFTIGACPWNEENQLAMITVSGEELAEPKPSNLVFLIDTSGSMSSYNKLPLVKQALSMLLDKLGENDKISIVTYASGTRVALEPTSATQKDKILGTINSLTSGGATAGASGINLAYEQAEKFKCDGNNRIILCTDGDFNVGISSTEDLEKLIEEKRESGIFLSVLGFGMGNYKDSKMEILADKGNGNYAYIGNLREAKKVLVDEMSKTIYTIAKDVKLQVEFNPEKVASYRLVGYENRVLNNEDFDNDKKDAGELGAGATVTVLYEIVPQNGDVKSSLKYQTAKSTGSDELMCVKIRYKLPDADESSLTEYPVSEETAAAPDGDFNFAAAVAELGMILNDSEYKGTSTYDSVIELAKEGLGDDRFGIRSEFVQLVDLLRYKEM